MRLRGSQFGWLDRGHEFAVNLLRKVQLQIAVNEEFVEPTVSAIIKGGRTGEKGEIGDGKIFISSLEQVWRIRTGETGMPEKQSVDCLLVTAENVDRFGLFELLPEPGSE